MLYNKIYYNMLVEYVLKKGEEDDGVYNQIGQKENDT